MGYCIYQIGIRVYDDDEGLNKGMVLGVERSVKRSIE